MVHIFPLLCSRRFDIFLTRTGYRTLPTDSHIQSRPLSCTLYWFPSVLDIQSALSLQVFWQKMCRNFSSLLMLHAHLISPSSILYYGGESVNRTQIDIKHKTCDIRTCKKYLFLGLSSTNFNTLVTSLYQCVETRSIDVFWLLSQSLPHLRFETFVTSEMFAMFLDPVVNRCTRHALPIGNISLWISFELSPFAHKKTAQ
jgi:hypothetical protein